VPIDVFWIFLGGVYFWGARKFALQGVSSRENGRELADGKGGDSEVGGSMERGIWMGGQRSGACGGCDGVGVREGEGWGGRERVGHHVPSEGCEGQ
jgi:hypothetical protein